MPGGGRGLRAFDGGTGLGLAITRQLVDLMGGEIGAASDVGCGSTFWFELTLPISAESSGAVPGGVALHADSLRGKRVLVADDVDLNRDLMLATLSRYGCDVELAVDGSEALSAVLARPFDLVLMDCQMPVMDGFAATRAIRSSASAQASIPVVAVTASAQDSHLDRCKEAGMDDHLTKPLSEIDLERILLRFLCVDAECLAANAAAAEAATAAPVPLGLGERYRLRKEATLDRIAEMIRSGRFTDLEAAEIVALAHQLAGTAGMFGDADLGEEARALETGLDSWTAEQGPDGVRAAYERLKLVA